MRIIGCDLHARQQTLAMLDTTTGEVVSRTLTHEGHDHLLRRRNLMNRERLEDRASWVRWRLKTEEGMGAFEGKGDYESIV